VQRAGRKNVEVRLPGYGSERTVPMPDELAAILERREELVHPSEWLFAGGEPEPPHQNTVGHQWRQTLERAGLDSIRLHDLRHFYASGLIADGCDVVRRTAREGPPRAWPDRIRGFETVAARPPRPPSGQDAGLEGENGL